MIVRDEISVKRRKLRRRRERGSTKRRRGRERGSRIDFAKLGLVLRGKGKRTSSEVGFTGLPTPNDLGPVKREAQMTEASI